MTEFELPTSGPMPRPRDTAQARLALAKAAFEAPSVSRITMEATEFTSICPMTGQPDFGTVQIEYVPGAKCIESRSLKFYLWSFRDEGAFCESLAARIADDIVEAVDPTFLRVSVRQNVRGGIALVAEATRERR